MWKAVQGTGEATHRGLGGTPELAMISSVIIMVYEHIGKSDFLKSHPLRTTAFKPR